jgi:hypothetical protein
MALTTIFRIGTRKCDEIKFRIKQWVNSRPTLFIENLPVVFGISQLCTEYPNIVGRGNHNDCVVPHIVGI